MSALPNIGLSSSGSSACEDPSNEIVEIDPLADPRWAEFVTANPDASVFHTTMWLTALQSAYGYQPRVVCTLGPDQRLTGGIVFCKVKSWLTGDRIVSLPFSDHCEPLVTAPNALDAMWRRLQEDKERHRYDYIELGPITQKVEWSSRMEECSTYFWHSVDLSPSCSDLFKSFDKDSVQRRIRRAERAPLRYEVGNSRVLLKEFFRLLVLTRRRHCLPPPPFAWFCHLSESFRDQLQIRAIYYQGRAIACIMTLKHKRTITYKYGCSDLGFKHLGITPLLFWKTIQEAKNEGLTRFDLGRSNIDNTGLLNFKENWRAERVTLKYLKSKGARRAMSNNFSPPLRRAFAALAPHWSLIGLGKFLYRHIG